MNPEFWHEAWRTERSKGFHEGVPNGFLTRWVGRFPSASRVLVPLCGKAEDLAFLAAHGHSVVGAELSEVASRAFFSEHGLEAIEERHGEFLSLSAGAVTIWVGDYFALTPELLGALTALYDRAAMIALPPELRARYVQHTRALLGPSTTGLLVTLEYEEGGLEGPPFSVPEREVRESWSSGRVELLETAPSEAPRTIAAGISASESAYWLSES